MTEAITISATTVARATLANAAISRRPSSPIPRMRRLGRLATPGQAVLSQHDWMPPIRGRPNFAAVIGQTVRRGRRTGQYRDSTLVAGESGRSAPRGTTQSCGRGPRLICRGWHGLALLVMLLTGQVPPNLAGPNGLWDGLPEPPDTGARSSAQRSQPPHEFLAQAVRSPRSYNHTQARMQGLCESYGGDVEAAEARRKLAWSGEAAYLRPCCLRPCWESAALPCGRPGSGQAPGPPAQGDRPEAESPSRHRRR